MTGLHERETQRREKDEAKGDRERAGGCKDAAAPNARFVSTRAMFVQRRKRSRTITDKRSPSPSASYAPRGLLATTLGKGRGNAAGGMWDTCFQGPDYPPSPSYTRTSLCSRNVPVDKTPEARRPDLYLV